MGMCDFPTNDEPEKQGAIEVKHAAEEREKFQYRGTSLRLAGRMRQMFFMSNLDLLIADQSQLIVFPNVFVH